jgi:hypothetical protein
MSDYFVPSTISAEAILVFLLFIALTTAATWFAARYYLLKRDFDSALQKMNREYGRKVEQERKKIRRIPHQLDQIDLLITEIRNCYYDVNEVRPKTSESETSNSDEG